MIVDRYFNDAFASTLIEDYEREEAEHVSSGKLSASMLGDPTQWQVLKMYGFDRETDPYVYGIFERGREVERSVVARLSRRMAIMDAQKEVEYRGVVGHMDGLVDVSGSVFNKGIIPLEVKSTKNLKFKRIVKEGKPQRGHVLQGALYALAEGKDWFVVDYVSAEDYRHHAFVLQTSEYRAEVDAVIDKFNAAIISGKIPVFDPPEAWMAKKEWNKFPEWAELNEEQCQVKLQEYLKKKIK